MELLYKTLYKALRWMPTVLLFLAIVQNPTAIENITEATDENKGDGYYYDLQGRRVQNPTRGIYIHNGKKIVVK